MSERELRALAKTQRENNLPVPKRKTKATLEVTPPDATTEQVATEQVSADEDEPTAPTNEEPASNSSDETMDRQNTYICLKKYTLLAIYYCVQEINNRIVIFLSYQTASTFESIAQFPVITICNLNSFQTVMRLSTFFFNK